MGNIEKEDGFFSDFLNKHDIIRYYIEKAIVLIFLLLVLLTVLACNPKDKNNTNNSTTTNTVSTPTVNTYSFKSEWGITKENDNIIVGLYQLGNNKEKTNIRIFSYSCNAKDQSIKNKVFKEEYFDFGNIKIKEFKFTNGLVTTNTSTITPIIENYSKIIESLDTNSEFDIILENKDIVKLEVYNKNFTLPCK